MKNKDTVKIKGLESGVTGPLRKKIIERSKQFQVAIVDINEYLTSQICNSCMMRNLRTIIKLTSGYPSHTVLVCKHCGTVWNRDVNALKNMLDISCAIWKNLERPPQFTKKSPQQTRVSSSDD